MKNPDIIKMLQQKGADKEEITQLVLDNPEWISELVNIIKTEKGSIKFGCDKIIQMVSEKQAELIYPYFDFFTKMLESDNKFLKWGALITIGNLVSVDKKDKFKGIFNKYYAFIKGDVMVSAANVIGKSAIVALAKPELIDKIIKEILKVEKTVFKHKGEISPECNNIVCGHAIDTFDKLYDQIENKNHVIEFVKRQLTNTREKVKKKAEKFIKKYQIK